MGEALAALAVAAIQATSEIVRAIKRDHPESWDQIRGRIRVHSGRLDALLRDAESDLAGWRDHAVPVKPEE